MMFCGTGPLLVHWTETSGRLPDHRPELQISLGPSPTMQPNISTEDMPMYFADLEAFLSVSAWSLYRVV